MKKWKPLIASLVVIALAFGAMAIWRFRGGPAANAANNAPANTPDKPATDGGLDLEWTKLEKLPALDPYGLWPRDGARLASPEIWIMWQTTGHTKCRLLATQDRRDWYNLGRTAGELHFMQASLAAFDSRLTFAVEFEANGKQYRSKAREVSFGKGSAFGQRHYKFTLGSQARQTWELEVTGGDARQLGQEAFLTTMFPDELVTFVAITQAGDSVVFGIDNADFVKQGCAGFLQVYDSQAGTYDRVLIELKR